MNTWSWQPLWCPEDIGLGKDSILGSRKGNVWVITHSLKYSTSVLRIYILIILMSQSYILNPSKTSGSNRHWQKPSDMETCSLSCAVCFPFGSYPCLYWSFQLQGRGPLHKVHLAEAVGKTNRHCRGPRPITAMHVTPSAVDTGKVWQGWPFYSCWGQPDSLTVKYFLDYAKGLFE